MSSYKDVGLNSCFVGHSTFCSVAFCDVFGLTDSLSLDVQFFPKCIVVILFIYIYIYIYLAFSTCRLF